MSNKTRHYPHIYMHTNNRLFPTRSDIIRIFHNLHNKHFEKTFRTGSITKSKHVNIYSVAFFKKRNNECVDYLKRIIKKS